MPSYPLPTTTSVLHLYRHLLREASYLPLLAKPYVTDRIKGRFRNHRRTHPPDRLIRKAGHDLRTLQAANSGSLVRMRQILLKVFGRTGHRRRVLISKFVQSEPPVDSIALQNLQEATAANSKKTGAPAPKTDWLAKWDTEKLDAYMKSQAAQGLTNTPTPSVQSRQVNLETQQIPALTAWGRPLSDAAIRTKLRKAWKKMVHRIQPPLPLGEWELLRDAASGKRPIEEWGIPPRRLPARTASEQAGSNAQSTGWSWEAYADKATRHVEFDRSRRLRAMSGAADTTSPTPQSPLDTHRYTPRLLRRLYREIWCMSSTVERDAQGKGWHIRWGHPEVPIPMAAAELFEAPNEVKVNAAPKEASKRTATAS